MIKDLYPTKFYEEVEVLDSNTLNALYNFVLTKAEHSLVLKYNDTPELEKLNSVIQSKSTLLANQYGFSHVQVSDRFAMHFFPAGAPKDMEIHADDFGDVGRKFIALLYLECEEGAGGELEFYDPRWFNGPWHSLSKSTIIKPETNKLVIFPSFLWHKVRTYHSKHFPRMALDAVISVS